MDKNGFDYLINTELLNNQNSTCDKCLSHKEELTYLFSCSHNICLIDMFTNFISNNFKGLEFDFITLDCPVCKLGSAKFGIEIWINILNHIFLQKNPYFEKKNLEINKYCNIHKKNVIIKYCPICKKDLCDLCIKNNHKGFIGHNLIDKNKMDNLAFDYFNALGNEYKQFGEELRKIGNIFFEKIENEYIIKKTKIDDLIRRLNQLLTEYTIQMNIFQKNMQNIFYIINISYFNYFNMMKNNEKTKDVNLTNKLIDVKFIAKYNIDINDISNYFFKKAQEALNAKDKSSYSPKIFNFELIWSDTQPKKKLILNSSKEEKLEGITKIIELKYSHSHNLVSSQVNGALDIWDLKEKDIIFRFKGHKSSIWSMIETSEGYIVTGSSDKTLKIWDPINLKENSIANLKGHKGCIYSIAQIEKNKIISGSEDATMKIWDIEKNKMQCIATYNDPNESKINSLTVLNQSNFVITGNDDNLIKIWNINPNYGFVTNVMKGHNCTVWCLLNFSEDELLASGSSDNVIRIWDLVNLKYLFSLNGHENTISSIVLLQNELMASSSWDKTCKIWNLNSRSCLYTLSGHKDIIWNVIELENGDIVTCSNDKSIIIWEKK